jgi:hypothetical protein
MGPPGAESYFALLRFFVKNGKIGGKIDFLPKSNKNCVMVNDF